MMPKSFAKLSARWKTFAEGSGNTPWADGITRCSEELDALIAEWASEILKAQEANKSLPSLGPLYSVGIAESQDVILRDILGISEKDLTRSR